MAEWRPPNESVAHMMMRTRQMVCLQPQKKKADTGEMYAFGERSQTDRQRFAFCFWYASALVCSTTFAPKSTNDSIFEIMGGTQQLTDD